MGEIGGGASKPLAVFVGNGVEFMCKPENQKMNLLYCFCAGCVLYYYYLALGR